MHNFFIQASKEGKTLFLAIWKVPLSRPKESNRQFFQKNELQLSTQIAAK